MLSIAVCDDDLIECCNMAGRIKDIMEEMKIPCIIRQFRSGRELLQALESFDIVFLDIIMQELDGMKQHRFSVKRHLIRYLSLYLPAGSMYLKHMMWKLSNIF